MTERKDLKPGSFYWVKPCFDVDFTPPGFDDTKWSDARFDASWVHWWNNEQPALFVGLDEQGEDKWVFVGQDYEGEYRWPVNWIGDEIVCPRSSNPQPTGTRE